MRKRLKFPGGEFFLQIRTPGKFSTNELFFKDFTFLKHLSLRKKFVKGRKLTS